MPSVEAKEEVRKFIIFLVEQMILASIDARRDKDFIGLKWLKMLLRCSSARNLYEGIFVCLLDIGDNRFLIAQSCKRSDVVKIKRKSSKFFVEEGLILKRLRSSTFEMFGW